MALSKQALDSDFAKDRYTDFEIKCGNKSFHLHKAVLRFHEYFRGLFEGKFEENQTGVLDLPQEDPEVFQCLLMHIYGAEWLATEKKCSKVDPELEDEMRHEYGDELFDSVLGQYNTSPTYYKVAENSPLTAKLLCYQLQRYALLYGAADHFLVPSLKSDICEAFSDKQEFAWSTSQMLRVISCVYRSGLPSDKGLRGLIIEGIADRIHLLAKIEQFQKMVPTLDGLPWDLVMENDRVPRPHWADESLRYCGTNQCRQNRPTRLINNPQKTRTCRVCKKREALSDTTQTALWKGEIEDTNDDDWA